METETLRRLAHAAADAYEPPTEAIWLRDSLNQCRGFMRWYDGAEIHISGTRSRADFLIDGKFIQKKTVSDGAIHEGFLKEFEAIQADVFDFVLSHPKKPVRISGHSLGGAIATLLAVELARDGYKVELVTLGSPRVGDAEFVETYNRCNIDHVRIVHADDIVPRLPKLRYKHVCESLHIDSDGKVIGRVRGFFHWIRFIDEILFSDLTGKAIEDHGVIAYLIALERYLDTTGKGNK